MNENSSLFIMQKNRHSKYVPDTIYLDKKVEGVAMSINNCILKTLNMEDKNIKFFENFVEERKIKGKRCLVYKGYLENNYDFCPECGCINENTIVKNGTRKSLIKIPKISELNSYLELKKQRYKCLNCSKRFTAQTSIVNYRCRISNNTKLSINNYSSKIITHKDIAWFHNVSNMTVQRVNNKVYDGEKLYKHYLPECMCFDEFTYKKGVMAFNICDAITGKTFDLVEDRKLENLIKYFRYYTLECRENVKYIVIDMYTPYISLIKECFPNASIIIDIFHIVQLISRSLNKTRIKVMRENKENYRKFKRYWRLFLTSRFDLDCSVWKKYLCFKNLMTEVDIVDYLLDLSSELKSSYNLYQNILYALQNKDYQLLENMLNSDFGEISKYMKTSINTLKEFLPYIKNTLENPYSNGVMERNNNTCKLIKRNAFGFRNFRNFKARILIITNYFRKPKEVMNFHSSPLNV